MKKLITIIAILSLIAVAVPALAQEEEKASTSFTYATYFYCDPTGEERVDEIVKTINAPVYDQMVKDGVITGWGWLAHHTGGKWRRIQYHQAGSLGALLDAQDEMDKRFAATDQAADKEFGKTCRGHDDYIWEAEAGSSGDSRGAAGFSVYYICDENREERADEIFTKDFGPIFDKYVKAGKLTSWGWQSHWVGGKYRRLQTMTGNNHRSLLKARGELIEEMYPEGSDVGEEFTDICGSHSDYMWNIQIETP